jgi:hypothetical protein
MAASLSAGAALSEEGMASRWTSRRHQSRRCCVRRCVGSPASSGTDTSTSGLAGERTDELWEAVARAGFVGVNLPPTYGGGGLGHRRAPPGYRGARFARLSAAAADDLPGGVRDAAGQVRHRGPVRQMATRSCERRRQDGFRHHGTRRRLELPSALDGRATSR